MYKTKKTSITIMVIEVLKKSRWRDSNPRPADYKSAALAS